MCPNARLSCVLAIALLAACAGTRPTGDVKNAAPGVVAGCSGASLATQRAIVESLVAGGTTGVHVRGWMCGRSEHGVNVRMVFLDYHDPAHEGLVPVIFEDGRMAAFGWDLLVKQPERWGPGTPRPQDRIDPPEGWIAFDLEPPAER